MSENVVGIDSGELSKSEFNCLSSSINFMTLIQKFYCCAFLFAFLLSNANPSDNILLRKGWAALVKDDENEAFRYFWLAKEKAERENNTADKAESILYLGICSFGSSLEKGLQFATKSLAEFKKLENSNPEQSAIGRSKCLQLISTIYSRQNKIKDAIVTPITNPFNEN